MRWLFSDDLVKTSRGVRADGGDFLEVVDLGFDDAFDAAEVVEEVLGFVGSDTGKALEEIQLLFSGSLRTVARTFEAAGPVTGELVCGDFQKTRGFLLIHGPEDGDSVDEADGGQGSLERRARDVDIFQIFGCPFQNKTDRHVLVSQAVGLPEQTSVQDGTREIRQGFSFDKKKIIDPIIPNRKHLNGYGMPFLTQTLS